MAAPSSISQRIALKKPFSPEEVQTIQQELKSILASSHFRNSRRYPVFLTYIVEASLQGRSEEIKERSIGVEAFGRSPDYDTNLDPIVRNTAGEVRKRLILYYAEPLSPQSRIEITLQPGTYVPEFYLLPVPAASEDIPESSHADKSASQDEVEQSHEQTQQIAATHASEQQGRHHLFIRFLGILLLAIAACAGAWYWWQATHSMQSLWADFFTTRHDVLIVVPEAPYPPNNTPENWARDNPDVALEDLTAILPPTGVLMQHHVPFDVKLDPSVTLADMVNRPVILVGGPTNKWTVTLTDSLRYHVKRDTQHLYIEDTSQVASPPCIYETGGTDGAVINDCALIARFHSSLTGSTVMVIAGAGRNGTQAAGEWITQPSLDRTLSNLFPSGWKNKNIEIVLKTTVIGGKNSVPTVVRAFSW
jgi:hypothetical protein